MGLPGFEPGSIEPKGPRNIDWSKYKQYLESKYVESYAKSLLGIHVNTIVGWITLMRFSFLSLQTETTLLMD